MGIDNWIIILYLIVYATLIAFTVWGDNNPPENMVALITMIVVGLAWPIIVVYVLVVGERGK